MQTHFYRKGASKLACGTTARRAAALACTSDRASFDQDRENGIACEKCCAGVDRMDAIAAKYQTRSQSNVRAIRLIQPLLLVSVACRNPECRGGFVGGEDPHACGDC